MKELRRTGKKHKDVSGWAFGVDLKYGLESGIHHVLLGLRSIHDVDRMLPPFHIQLLCTVSYSCSVKLRRMAPTGAANANGAHSPVKEACKVSSIQGGRHDQNLERSVGLFPFLLDVFQETEDEVGPETSLMRFVDDDHIVAIEVGVGQHLLQQSAVGDKLESGFLWVRLVVKANGVANGLAQETADFFSHTSGQANGCYSTRLRDTDRWLRVRNVGVEDELRYFCQEEKGVQRTIDCGEPGECKRETWRG